MTERKIVQIAAIVPGVVFALCEDGTLWGIGDKPVWQQLPPIPQPEPDVRAAAFETAAQQFLRECTYRKDSP